MKGQTEPLHPMGNRIGWRTNASRILPLIDAYGRPTSSDGSGAGPLIDGDASPTAGAVGGVVSVLVAPTVIVLLFATS